MSQHEPTSRAGERRCDAEERRALVREVCYWQVTVFVPFPMTATQKRHVVTLRDISANGAGLLLAERLELGQLLIVELKNASGTFSVSKISQVVYAHENPEGFRSKRWQVGCEFNEPLTGEQLQALLS